MLLLTNVKKRDNPCWLRNGAKYRRYVENSFISYVKYYSQRSEENFFSLER